MKRRIPQNIRISYWGSMTIAYLASIFKDRRYFGGEFLNIFFLMPNFTNLIMAGIGILTNYVVIIMLLTLHSLYLFGYRF